MGKPKPNIFFVVIDAVRFDHLSCYGYSKKTSPNIDTIAEEGVLFENAISAAPWSPDSHASMFTGLYPSHHGVLGENLYLSEEIPNIVEHARSEGYQTLGICPNAFVSPHFGFRRGFNEFLDAPNNLRLLKKHPLDWIVFGFETDLQALMYRWIYQATVFQKIKKWITLSRRKNKPFFIFINYFDAHLPYCPPRPFNRRFGNIRNGNIDVKKIEECFNKRFGFPYIAKEVEITKEEWDSVISSYDAEIAYIDFFIGKVFDYLQKYELLDDTFILVTSDHGENLGDHQLASHAFCLYDTLIHVPLIINFPKNIPRGKRISSLVSTVDIFPTLLTVLDIENKYKTDGENLSPFEERIYHEYVFAEYGPPIPQIKTMNRLCPRARATSNIYNKGLRCVRSTDFKYVMASNGKEEWYDLKNDPNERKNIINEIPQKKRQRLESVITQELGDLQTKKRVAVPHEEIRKRLQELGYF